LQELNALIDPSLGWVLMCAHDINDAGQIAGYAYNSKTGLTHAVRLQPSAMPPPVCTIDCLRSTRIVLSSKAGNVIGVVSVQDETGARIGGAMVLARWTYPDGSRADHYVQTRSTGKARFVTPGTQPGRYTLEVVNILLSSHTFDPAHSVLTKSIVVP
jgi:hypothetical protein